MKDESFVCTAVSVNFRQPASRAIRYGAKGNVVLQKVVVDQLQGLLWWGSFLAHAGSGAYAFKLWEYRNPQVSGT